MAEIVLDIVVDADTPEEADEVCRVLNGKAPDPWNIVLPAQDAAGNVLLSKVKRAFMEKADHGTDEAGIKWKPLDPKTVAYHRRIPARRTEKGILTSPQIQFWRGVFMSSYLRFAKGTGHEGVEYRRTGGLGRPKKGVVAPSRMPVQINNPEAAKKAAQLAWALTKQKFGNNTLIAKFGNHPVKILRDTDELFKSLSAGVMMNVPGTFTVGTNKKPWHHEGKGVPERLFWPEDDNWPQDWMDDMATAYQSVIMGALA